jgi:hypothetical protein
VAAMAPGGGPNGQGVLWLLCKGREGTWPYPMVVDLPPNWHLHLSGYDGDASG